jgi:Prephenate dehydrogenase
VATRGEDGVTRVAAVHPRQTPGSQIAGFRFDQALSMTAPIGSEMHIVRQADPRSVRWIANSRSRFGHCADGERLRFLSKASFGEHHDLLGRHLSPHTRRSRHTRSSPRSQWRIAPSLRGAILTDVGSVKQAVIRDLAPHVPPGVHVVPGQPVAGTERSGPEAGFAELFAGRWCILIPLPETAAETVTGVTRMWERQNRPEFHRSHFTPQNRRRPPAP